jgi:hypothetical protein
MPTRDEIIYHERNGEVVIYDADAFHFFSRDRSQLRELASYKMDESPYGYFRVTLYFDDIRGIAFREWLWIPSFGYSWSEYKIEVVS